VVPFGPQTSRALDRYLRARRGHRLAGTPALWLGDRGKAFSYDALHKTLGERARTAGIEGFRPHRLRHTAAHRWLAAGGSEGGLMAVAGWTRPDMLLRYTRAQASARAAAEAPRAGARRLLTAVGNGHSLEARLPARRRPHQGIGVVPLRASPPQPAGLRQAGRWSSRWSGGRPTMAPPVR